MPCAHCIDIEKEFDRRTAARDLKRYRRRGPRKTTRMLLQALRQRLPERFSHLDIGGGVGMIAAELVRAGATDVTLVDASSAYLNAARENLNTINDAVTKTFRHGDFLEVEKDIPPADVVTLDRVICCYPHVRELVRASSDHARRLYGLVYPRKNPIMKLFVIVANLYLGLRKCAFRVYLHDPDMVQSLLAETGWTPYYQSRTFIWRVEVYAKSNHHANKEASE